MLGEGGSCSKRPSGRTKCSLMRGAAGLEARSQRVGFVVLAGPNSIIIAINTSLAQERLMPKACHAIVFTLVQRFAHFMRMLGASWSWPACLFLCNSPSRRIGLGPAPLARLGGRMVTGIPLRPARPITLSSTAHLPINRTWLRLRRPAGFG